MKTIKQNLNVFRYFIIIFLVLFVISVPKSPDTLLPLVYAQQEEVDLEISLRQEVFRVSEPVIVQLTLVNKGKRSVSFNPPNLSTQMVRYWVRPKDGVYQEYELNFVEEPSGESVKLKPGGRYQQEELIHFNYATNALAFPVPGTYTLKVEYAGYISAESLPKSAEISLQIIDNPRSEREMASLFSQKEVANFLNNTTREPEIIQRLEKAINRFPNSLFSLYARYYLALHKARQYHNQEADFEAAVTLMQKADVKGWQLQPEVLLHLAQWSWRLGEPQKSFGYLDRVIMEFLGTAAAKVASELKDSFSKQTAPALPRKSEPIESKLKSAIYATIREYFSAFQQGNIVACLALLAEDFKYNEALDKNSLAVELKEDFDKLKQKGGVLKIQWEVIKLDKFQGTPVAEIEVLYLLDGKPLSASQRLRAEFIQKDKRWFFKSLKVLGQRE